MNIRNNKRLLNGIMVSIIAVIIIGGIAAAGSIKGWFGSSENAVATAKDIAGVVNIERKGVIFNADEDTALLVDDTVRTNEKAGVTIARNDSTMDMNESSELLMTDFEDKKLSVKLNDGEMFVIAGGAEDFGKIFAQENEITFKDSVFSVNVQTGSMGINVFSGEVSIAKGEEKATARSGEAISVAGDEFFVTELQITALNEFNIEKAQHANQEHELCFTDEELEKVLEERQNEMSRTGESEGNGENGKEGSATSGNTAAQSKGSSGGLSSGAAHSEGQSSGLSCTIEIRCDTILNNMGSLTPGKAPYVPSSGTVLATTSVSFSDGETVFDVLNRICQSKGIQLEYSYTPMYGSYYVEGINNLYEFDCGSQSGWMYKVNGWFPNYGCSGYKLKDGDVIVWCYTCSGLGADVGGGMS